MLSESCITLFYTSIKHRFYEYCHEESKANNLETLFNYAFESLFKKGIKQAQECDN